MARELKEIIVQDFGRRLSDMESCVLIDYQGLDAEKTTELRSVLRKEGVRMTVLHNRLAGLALREREDIPEGFTELFRGPTAVLFGEDGALAASKALGEWQKKNKGLAPAKGGLLSGRLLSPQEVDELAKIPDRDTLQGMVAGMFASPFEVLSRSADSLVTHLAGCAKARHQELEGN